MNLADYADLAPGRDLYVNTRHAKIPRWAWTHQRVTYARLKAESGYVQVITPDGETREIHHAHLRKTPLDATAREADRPGSALAGTRPRTLTGAVHHIAPEHGTELTIDDLLEGL